MALYNNSDIVGFGYGGDPSTSNNVMELTAALRGLQAAQKYIHFHGLQGIDIYLVSDSQYTLGVASGANRILANVEIATQLRKLALGLNTKTKWVRGHSGDPWNERVDRFAKRGKEEAVEALRENR